MAFAAPQALSSTTEYLLAYREGTRYLKRNFKGAKWAVLQTVLDKTIGFMKEVDVISYSLFEAETAYSEDAIIRAATELCEMTGGLLRRIEEGNSFKYWLVLPDWLTSHISHLASRMSHPVCRIPQAADVDNSTTDDRRPTTDVDNHPETAPDSPHALSPSTEVIPETPPAPQQKPAQTPRKMRDTSRYVTKTDLKDKAAEEKIGGNWRMLVDISRQVTDAGGYRLANLPYLARRALEMGLLDGDVWSVWEDCCKVARWPIALFLKILQGEAEIPTVPRPKPARRSRKAREEREEPRPYFPHDPESRRQRQALVAPAAR